MVIPTLEVSQYILQTEAVLGETVTLSCHVTGYENGLFYWYRMTCGYMIQTVATGYFNSLSLEANFNISRFEVKKVDNEYSLIIKNVLKEDEGTYFCQAGAAYRMAFVNGTHLAVKQYDVTSHKTLFANRTTVETGMYHYSIFL